jgi:hypothetical protein
MAVGVGEGVCMGGRVDAAGGRSLEERADAQAASMTDTNSNRKVERRIIEKPLWVIAREVAVGLSPGRDKYPTYKCILL